MVASALTLLLALAASGEPAPAGPVAQGAAAPMTGAEGPAAPTSEPEGTAPSSPSSPAGAEVDLRGWRQDLALGLHTTTFWSNTDHHYTFHSLSLGYLASWGRRGLFVHATGLLPLQGREDGHVFAVSSFYSAHYGGDLLTGYQWRWRARRTVEAEAGAGPHATFLVLKGVTGYRDFSASPLGLGGEAMLRWRTGHKLSRWPLTVGVYGSAAVDFYDPFHGNDLRHGFTFRAGVSLGLEPGGPR
jgi:hypothetical protein